MRNFALLAVGLLLLLLQANLHRAFGAVEALLPLWAALRLHGTTPNLVLPIVIFLGVHEPGMVRGALLSFCLGYAVDVVATAPIGLFTFVFVAVWWLARLAGVRLTAQTLLPRMSLAFVFALVEGVLVLVLLAVFGSDTKRPVEIATILLPRAITTALCAPLVFRLAQRLHQGNPGVRGPTPEATA